MALTVSEPSKLRSRVSAVPVVGYKMAIADFNAGKFESGTQAARAYGVPPSTFHDRMGGKQPQQITHQHEQQLTPI